MTKRRQQKRAKPPTLPIRARDPILLQQAHDEPLRKILRILRRVPLPPGEVIKRPPIIPAQTGQRFARIFRRGIPRQQHAAPARGHKNPARRRALRCVGCFGIHRCRISLRNVESSGARADHAPATLSPTGGSRKIDAASKPYVFPDSQPPVGARFCDTKMLCAFAIPR